MIFLLSCALLLPALTARGKIYADAPSATPVYDARGFDAIRDAPDGSYRLANDVELPENFIPIAEFTGTLDGGDHTLTVKARGCHEAGYAPITKNSGVVTGVRAVCDVDVSVGEDALVGGIVAENLGEIYGCSVSGRITAEAGSLSAGEYIYAGGVAGYSEADISECVSDVAISLSGTGIMHVGGIVGGIFECVIMNCRSDASVYGEGSTVTAGGICGESDGKTGYSSFGGAVSAKAVSADGKNSYAYAGGISGYALDHIVQCENSGDITAGGDSVSTAYAGGCCGIIYGRINRFENCGRVYADAGAAIFAGGVTGRSCDVIIDSVNTADVAAYGSSGTVAAGGIAGKAHSVNGCSSSADIKATGGVLDAGGVAGDCDNLSGCVSEGKIVCGARETRVGGTAGTAGYIAGCESSCEIEASGIFCEIFAGGIAAKAYNTVSDSFFSGAITAETAGGYIYAGGVIAYNSSGVSDCRATPSITLRMEANDASGVIAAGCIAGGNYGEIARCGGTAKIYANAILNTTVRGSGRKISLFAGNNAGLTRGRGSVSGSSAQSRINAYIISGGVAKPKLNYD
ncbi:MAG: hypothetical protein J5940_01500 [Clostridia bacterium]|nr:hypothetical protein [Clostridia bacterium]